MDTKKEIERKYLDVFSRGIVDFPLGSIEESETPDFLIQSSVHRIGIEITRLFHGRDRDGGTLSSQDGEQKLAVTKAQQIALDRDVSPVLADVYFDSRLNVGKRDRTSIAEKLVDLVSAHMPELGEYRSLENRHPLAAQFPPQVQAVCIWRFSSVRSHLWQVGAAGIVRERFAQLLRAVVAEKHQKITAYRSKCDECWLVIVADWSGPSAFFEMTDQTIGESYLTSFERVYFLEGHSGRVMRLRTQSFCDSTKR